VFDLLLLGSLAAAFAAAVGYIYACVGLTRPAGNASEKQP
jgi:hypothetical protein